MADGQLLKPDIDTSFPPSIHVPCLSGSFRTSNRQQHGTNGSDRELVIRHLSDYVSSAIGFVIPRYIAAVYDEEGMDDVDDNGPFIQSSDIRGGSESRPCNRFSEIIMKSFWVSAWHICKLSTATCIGLERLYQIYHDVRANRFHGHGDNPDWTVIDGDLGTVITALESMARLGLSAASGSILILAAWVGDPYLIRMLMDGSSLTRWATDIAFIVSCFHGRSESIKELIGSGVVIDDRHVSLALQCAVFGGSSEIVSQILSISGLNMSDNHKPALFLACEHGHTKIVARILSEPGVRPDIYKGICLAIAAANNRSTVVEMLLKESSVDPGCSDSWAFRLACHNGHVESAQLLIAARNVDPAARASEALWRASGNGQASVVKLLLDNGRADPGARHSLALILASAFGHTDVVQALISDGRSDPVSLNCAAMKAAIIAQNYECVEIFLGCDRVQSAVNESLAWPEFPLEIRREAIRIARECGDGRALRRWSNPLWTPQREMTDALVIIRLMKAGISFSSGLDGGTLSSWQIVLYARSAVSFLNELSWF